MAAAMFATLPVTATAPEPLRGLKLPVLGERRSVLAALAAVIKATLSRTAMAAEPLDGFKPPVRSAVYKLPQRQLCLWRL